VSIETQFMLQAIELAELGPYSSNPRVGAVCVSDGVVVGTGYHHGAGTAHAEVEALAVAGERAANADLYVSLEPCSHFGRTPPCTQAIIDAGIRRVFFAQLDPSGEAGGGAGVLKAAKCEVVGEIEADRSMSVNREWNHRMRTGVPFVTWKFAQSLDGRVAAKSGERTSISGEQSQVFNHDLRSRVAAILVGTQTFIVDQPSLSAREADGSLKVSQPLKVVMGMRDVAPAEFLHLATRDPKVALLALADLGINHVLLEGGPTLAAAFIQADCIDEVISITAPITLGAGPRSLITESPFMRPLKITATFTLGLDLIHVGELESAVGL
jgi:diaminohydroxyphosphoribosylaminopyrimidine deaminase/5-amino-6-(5-phosphoribosylamino)uracil reductase